DFRKQRLARQWAEGCARTPACANGSRARASGLATGSVSVAAVGERAAVGLRCPSARRVGVGRRRSRGRPRSRRGIAPSLSGRSPSRPTGAPNRMGSVSVTTMIVPAVVQQHVDDAALLASTRLSLVDAPHHRLDQLARFDRRLAAHLDGLRLSGEEGRALCDAALESPSAGVIFMIAVGSLEERDYTRLARISSLVQAVPDTQSGLLAALAWIEPSRLHGTVARLLRGRDPF